MWTCVRSKRFRKVALHGHVTHLAAAMARTDELSHLILLSKSVAKSDGPIFLEKTRHVCGNWKNILLRTNCARLCSLALASVQQSYIRVRSNWYLQLADRPEETFSSRHRNGETICLFNLLSKAWGMPMAPKLHLAKA